MFENKYDIAYKFLIAAFILIALYSMLHPATAEYWVTAPGTYMINATA
jgi:hypothetical protein